MYIGSAVWPTDKEVTSATDLGFKLSKVVHENNIGDYAPSKAEFNNLNNDILKLSQQTLTDAQKMQMQPLPQAAYQYWS